MLRTTYWVAEGPRSVIEAAARSSHNFSMRDRDRQVAYARVVSDGCTFAWIADVIVAPEVRGRGLGVWLMECVMEHPSVAGTTQQLLRTQDAHGLYRRFGFEVCECKVRRAAQAPSGPSPG